MVSAHLTHLIEERIALLITVRDMTVDVAHILGGDEARRVASAISVVPFDIELRQARIVANSNQGGTATLTMAEDREHIIAAIVHLLMTEAVVNRRTVREVLAEVASKFHDLDRSYDISALLDGEGQSDDG